MQNQALESTPISAVSEQDHYAEHLAEVNKDVDVVATEDIVNQHGVLIARKGSRIDHSAAKRLIQHKLSRPLEQQVQLSENVDTSAMYASWLQLMRKFPDLAQMHVALGFEQTYQEVLTTLKIHPLLSQKLSVLVRQMPEWYEKALFCAWLAALVVREMGLDDSTLRSAIVAGLSHDIGFLHLDPQTLAKRGKLTPEEWRAIQAHVVIGQLFLADLPDMDERIPSAVLEHHERYDGTGYPFGKTSHSLQLLGKVVGLADSLQAIRINQFAATGRTLRDAMPYLQMNDFTNSLDVYRAASALLKKSGLQPARINPHGTIRAWAQRLGERCTALQEIREPLMAFEQLLLEKMAGEKQYGATLIAVLNNVLVKIASAGLGGTYVLDWLSSCGDDDENALSDLNETDLMVNELIWHVNHVQRTAEGYFEKECVSVGTAHKDMDELIQKIVARVTQLRNAEQL
jgi:HD-GYP domain-containing protein (c-di-GMP phosphodiesterase class II)